jgi:hypothetical protein
MRTKAKKLASARPYVEPLFQVIGHDVVDSSFPRRTLEGVFQSKVS